MSYMQMQASAREEALHDLGAGLQQTLVELIDLGLVARQLHWTLVGPSFGSLHPELDELSGIAHELADRVAERAVTLGLQTDGLASTVSGQSGFEPPAAAATPDQEALRLLSERLAEMGQRLHARIEHVAAIDPVSEDLLRELLALVEKRRWLFDAQRRLEGR